MKKLLKLAFASLFMLMLFNACVPVPVQEEMTDSDVMEETIKPDVVEVELQSTSDEVLALLKAKDFEAISEYIHPEKGVRFSPYATVDIDNDVVIMPEELNETEEMYLFGVYDGSGEPIETTLSEYFDKFVYDQDFINAEMTAVNEIIGTGNSISNVQKIYTEGSFIEYHFTGFEDQYEGMDWVSLRLVFEDYEGEMKLVGVIHDQWTI